ncbi:CYTH domain-containing protein [Candidatus Uhrbacteria bacterium]|nr:CYTH domain-containing protein [Candidatus Uhrbacteria bacterium]
MAHINIEIKARCQNQDAIREILRSRGAVFKGTDHQIDTYFRTPKGRLKLREGNIENVLVFYEREDQLGSQAIQCEIVQDRTRRVSQRDS